ncbi:Decaprenylphosphoryl-beta-D-ribose oxidase [Paenibacillus allorhizoplanae]|uniref:Decaprenylphosphoryl-beta-D-ribose oxidase n=1 Tax=Paenibacillus allorhizoplanae TaxID=2905648 RepID=A0ABM9CU46_9BACL|nr:FAD-binding oxidoreductase [Paenibacillus allorhizoplanae]CAH1224463.1 Decaprenylphosphoryl-beta-D-ribose oxidase [Paenibacillus allorhizoplanae]
MKKIVVLLLLTALCLWQYARTFVAGEDPFLRSDYSKLRPVKIERVIPTKEIAQLQEIVREAREKELKISIAGQRHSQGGHTYYKDGIVLDMTPFNKVLAFDEKAKTITIQSGATWADVQKYINPYGLAVKTMQSQNIFTIGGSISVNAHGRDIRNGSLIRSVDSFRLLGADGQIKNVSRFENAELFPLALGGYGLFGVIVDVTLSLTDDEVYEMTSETMTTEAYSDYFLNQVKQNPDIHMHLARISVAPDTFLTEMYATNYRARPDLSLPNYNKLKLNDSYVLPLKILFGVNRTFDWGKNAFWDLQRYFLIGRSTILSRNNAMRSESDFMDYSSDTKNDLLQEFFIPVEHFASFINGIKPILKEEQLNLLNITVRYVNQDEEAVLSYAKSDMFALVCLFNTPLSEEGQARMTHGIQRIIDQLMSLNGSYYLPYAPFPSVEQFRTIYPKAEAFFLAKDKWDPQHLFMNQFYDDYRGH